jgi:lipopolysaccharide transport system permease protein
VLTYSFGGHKATVMREWPAEIWQYRELLWFLAWRDVKVRYKQTVLGAGWAVLQPLLGMIVFTTFFGRLIGTSNVDVPYPIFTYCALVPWTYFSGTLSHAGNSLVTNSNLITKVYFPRVLLPASSALSGLLDFLVGSAFLAGLMAYYRIPPTWALLFYPVLMLAMWTFTLGVSMWLAALNARYRDVKYTIPFLIQLGLFATPVIYPKASMPHRIQQLLVLNPLAGIIEGFRACLFPRHQIDVSLIAGSAVVGAVLFAASSLYFRNTERDFADIL